jgi:membrane associated rhomboid family serine protease
MQGQIRLPTLAPIGRLLIISSVALFLIRFLLTKTSGIDLYQILGLTPARLSDGHIYTLATYGLLAHDFFGLLFDALIIWFIGSDLEVSWGRRRFLSFLACTAVGGAIIYAGAVLTFFSSSWVVGATLPGLAGIAGALCVAYGVLYPDRTMYLFFFPLKAKFFVMILIAMTLWQGASSPGGVVAWGQLTAYASGMAWMLFVSRGQPRKGSSKSSAPWSKGKAKLKLVKDNKDDDQITYH